MEKINTLVIGAGAVGLAIGYVLSKAIPDLVVVDKEDNFGKHTSSRNSEVIHSGLYYPAGSLKATLCVEGNVALYDFLDYNGIPFSRCGKIIVSCSESETRVLETYYTQGRDNGCLGLKLLSQDEIKELEPLIKCQAGLYVPSTGIFDTHRYMDCLARGVENNDAYVVYGMKVVGIKRLSDSYCVDFENGESYQCDSIINAGGLWADEIAEMAGIDIEPQFIKQYPCKGEYFKSTKIQGVNHLVYPVADPNGVFLGIHLTINLNGEIRFGPNAFYVNEIDYRFDEGMKPEFYNAVNRYIDVNYDDLMADDTGIRPKLQGPGTSFRDFYIKEESHNGLPGFVNLIGIESPGLTASLAIAGYVKNLLGLMDYQAEGEN